MPPACNDDDDAAEAAAGLLTGARALEGTKEGDLPRLTIRLWDESLPGKKRNIKHKDGSLLHARNASRTAYGSLKGRARRWLIASRGRNEGGSVSLPLPLDSDEMKAQRSERERVCLPLLSPSFSVGMAISNHGTITLLIVPRSATDGKTTDVLSYGGTVRIEWRVSGPGDRC